jgi:hypothetical protein
MTNRELVERFRRLESELAEERGDFVFFALFLLENLPDRWDLMISARWLDTDKQQAIRYLADQIKAKIGVECLLLLSRVIVIDPDNANLQDLARSLGVEHGALRIQDDDFFGLRVRDARIITAKAPSAPATT